MLGAIKKHPLLTAAVVGGAVLWLRRRSAGAAAAGPPVQPIGLGDTIVNAGAQLGVGVKKGLDTIAGLSGSADVGASSTGSGTVAPSGWGVDLGALWSKLFPPATPGQTMWDWLRSKNIPGEPETYNSIDDL